MKKHITIGKLVLCIILLITFSVSALYFFDTSSLAKSINQGTGLDELYGDMGVIKVPDVKVAVEIKLKDVHGNEVRLSDFRGKIVFLNFWTTWCPTCRIEMPSMEKLHQKFKDKDFAMVAIDLQESASQVKAFFKEYKLTFTALLDSTGEVGTRFRINSIPTTLILDQKGQIIAKAVGPRKWDSKKSIALFKHLTDQYVATSMVKAVQQR
jgi:thiol-disulfide isomerase/thioredoxin